MIEMIEKKKYCVGFLFDIRKEYVMLIKKTKPAWQYGKLNGVGGKLELGESPMEAMVREFKEETNLDTTTATWKQFCDLSFPDAVVYFHKGYSTKYAMDSFENMTEEEVSMRNIKMLWEINPPMIPNLKWLIPMALSLDDGEKASSFTIHENFD